MKMGGNKIDLITLEAARNGLDNNADEAEYWPGWTRDSSCISIYGRSWEWSSTSPVPSPSLPRKKVALVFMEKA
jgi:hypothetical protein